MNRDLLERILAVSRHMAETRALNPMLEYAIDEAIYLAGAERGYLVLIDPDNSLVFRVQRGQEGEDLHDGDDQVSRSILTRVIQSGTPLVIHDALSDPNFNSATSVVRFRIRSVMSVPLIAHGDTIGAIYVENRAVSGRFTEDTLAPLIFFANQAAVLIENATLYGDLEERVAQRTRQLEEAKAQIEENWTEVVEANRLRTVLLGNVAHDLRAPLAIVIAALTMLRDGMFGTLQPEQVTWISKSLEASNYVLNLTSDVFDLVKLDLGVLRLSPQETPLDTFLHELYDLALGMPHAQEVEFRLDLRSELPSVLIDPVRIRQILLNLLSNAFKFTKHGSVTLHAASLPESNEVLIGVADTGEGITLEQLGRLFQRYQQVDTDTRRRRSGTGLGLAICRDLVEMHQGRIWADSTPGVGSDFNFILPVHADFPPSDLPPRDY
ncbi:MAG TPA: ATP-binding protein [Aggregatilineales bacterium]|nr:ATP-binding protein [Aggregatilineales bacterium]